MNKKQKSSIVVASLAAIAIAGSLIAGSTYALFTSESKTNIAVNSGTVNVVASIDSESLITYSGKENSLVGDVTSDEENIKSSTELGIDNGKFLNGGTASINATTGDLELKKVTPGDKVKFTINVENKSNVAIKYRTIISCSEDDGLFNGLKFTIGSSTFDGRTSKTNWTPLSAGASVTDASLDCIVNLPSDAGDEYQDTSCKVSYTVEAVQGNALTTDEDDNLIEVYTVSDLKWVQKNNSELTSSKTVKLMNNLDLSGENWTPIGNATAKPFVATFDGNGKTISNLTTTKYSYINDENQGYGSGLFGYVSNATIKNLVIEDANVGGISDDNGVAIYSEVGIVAGCTYGNSTFDHITINNSTVKAQTKVAAIVGQSNAGGSGATTTITNCSLTNVTVSGNYSYALVCGLINQAASTVVFTGTTVDSDSKTEFWTNDSCYFKNSETSTIYKETYSTDTYRWETIDNSTFFITEVANAWTVQRSTNPSVTSNEGVTGVSGTLKESIIYLGLDPDGSNWTRTLPHRFD